MTDLFKLLATIQQTLKAPKNQFNKFGNYKYRSCEDIVEAVKPLLGESYLIIGDEVIQVGDRYYVKATATLTNGVQKIENTALAREPEEKKGMDSSQITGTASSYARKYALNGLFAIDDTKDSDFVSDVETKQEKPVEEPKTVTKLATTPSGDVCKDCGGERVLNPKTGKMFCKDKCWLKPAEPPSEDDYMEALQADSYGMTRKEDR